MIEFQNSIQQAGITPPASLHADGALHRFHVEGDKPRSENGWYVLHQDPPAGAFGCWKRNISETWNGKEYRTLTTEEKARYRANMEAAKRQREEGLARVHAECRKKSAEIWSQAQSITEHSYTIKKGVSIYGLREYNGSLVVPVRDVSGVLHGLQFIDSEGGKKFKTGTNKAGCYYSIGGKPETILYLAEGYATAATIHESTGQPVAVCFDAGNLKPVAEALRGKFPCVQLVLCADDDRNREGNPGLTKATEAALAVGGLVAIPQFPDGAEGTDFNDLAQVASLDEVCRQIDGAASPVVENEQKTERVKVVDISAFLRMKFPPRETLLAPWLPAQGLAMVYAPRGIGKTHFSLGVAYAVTSAGTFLQWTAEQPKGVLFIDGEMPGNVLQERFSAIAVSNDNEPSAPLRIITPDLQPNGSMLNLSDPADQHLIDSYLDDIALIIVDNISTLCRSGKEAEGESWLPVQQWALQQRAAGRSVLFIHHAGKNGEQRGTSRREDVLDTVIALKRPGDYTPDQGACFEVHFEKARGLYGDDTKPFEAKLTTDQNNYQAWCIKPLEQSTAEKVAALLNEGVAQGEIPEMLGITKGSVSKAKKRAQQDGLLLKMVS